MSATSLAAELPVGTEIATRLRESVRRVDLSQLSITAFQLRVSDTLRAVRTSVGHGCVRVSVLIRRDPTE